ncbi:MAG TPA: chorismate mutase [Gemmatimonadales bacterium]|nr:chorismate mutase [Gemmatimonadales bacterium]
MRELDHLRADIEHLDRVLIGLIGTRVRTARRAGQLKRAAGLPIRDPAQEVAVLERAARLAGEAGLPVEATRELFARLVGLARQAELEP